MDKVILLDIGGTWLKGALVEYSQIDNFARGGEPFSVVKSAKTESRLSEVAPCSDFIEAIEDLLPLLITPGDRVVGIGVSTAGVVNYAGTKVLVTAPHLKTVTSQEWIRHLEQRFSVPVIIINDADSVMLAAARLGYLSGEKTYGIMPVGTGLGFCVLRNGRRWSPNFSYTLLGTVSTPCGTYDELASVVGLLKRNSGVTSRELFYDLKYKDEVNSYIDNLARIIQSSYYLYHTTDILLGGGLADFAESIQFPLEIVINKRLEQEPLLGGVIQRVRVPKEGNQLAILGAGLLAHAEIIAQRLSCVKVSKVTERPYDESLMLHEYESTKIIETLWGAEQESSLALKQSLPKISKVVDNVVDRLKNGGRIIYVGAGTSGRLAAIDTVEIGCTFGFPRERVLTLISGGVADAAIDIESNFEEDASCVPDIISTGLNKNDVVIGISVSGSAYYVQSALAYAKEMGAYSVMIQEKEEDELSFCNDVVGLYSGSEVISGSTRMKAGTSTKKVINFISTATMIQLGLVYKYYMVGLECTNVKLQKRAQRILCELFSIDAEIALLELQKNNFALSETIFKLSKQ